MAIKRIDQKKINLSRYEKKRLYKLFIQSDLFYGCFQFDFAEIIHDLTVHCTMTVMLEAYHRFFRFDPSSKQQSRICGTIRAWNFSLLVDHQISLRRIDIFDAKTHFIKITKYWKVWDNMMMICSMKILLRIKSIYIGNFFWPLIFVPNLFEYMFYMGNTNNFCRLQNRNLFQWWFWL